MFSSNVIQLANALANGEDCHFALHDALLETGYQEEARMFQKKPTEISDAIPAARWLKLLTGRTPTFVKSQMTIALIQEEVLLTSDEEDGDGVTHEGDRAAIMALNRFLHQFEIDKRIAIPPSSHELRSRKYHAHNSKYLLQAVSLADSVYQHVLIHLDARGESDNHLFAYNDSILVFAGKDLPALVKYATIKLVPEVDSWTGLYNIPNLTEVLKKRSLMETLDDLPNLLPDRESCEPGIWHNLLDSNIQWMRDRNGSMHTKKVTRS